MNIIVRIKRLFRKKSGKYILPDTSVWSTYLEQIKILVKEGSKVIVTEGTRQELRDGYRKYQVCREAYDYITHNSKLIFPITADKMKSWPVDDQNVAIAYDYFKKGLQVTFITCDREQAHKAEIRGMEVNLLPCLKNQPKKSGKEQSKTEQIEERENEVLVPCVLKGQQAYISVNMGVEVYTNKGKRRIGRGPYIEVNSTDILQYKGCNYTIEAVNEQHIVLKKM